MRWGNWAIEGGHGASGGNLFIREVGSAGFVFDLAIWNGSRTGNNSGFARVVSPDIAYARVTSGGVDQFCELASYSTRFVVAKGHFKGEVFAAAA